MERASEEARKSGGEERGGGEAERLPREVFQWRMMKPEYTVPLVVTPSRMAESFCEVERQQEKRDNEKE